MTSACNTVTVEDCKTADWRGVGIIDGRLGLTEKQFVTHRNSCLEHGSDVDENKYREGRKMGLEEYCTPAGGYAAGSSGKFYENVCPMNLEDEFLTNYVNGQKAFQLDAEHARAANDLAAERKRISEDKSVVGDVANVFSLISGKSRTADEEAREQKLDGELQKQRSLAPNGVENFRSTASIDGLRGYAGAFIGPFIGFGVGHTIQGTYRTSGWQWTAIDSAVFTSLFVVSHNCPDGTTQQIDGTRIQTSEASACSKTAIPIALLTLVGTRIWEGIGLWKHAAVMASPYRNAKRSTLSPDSISTMPSNEGFNANLSWNL